MGTTQLIESGECKHIDEWMEQIPISLVDKLVKDWLIHFRRPAADQNHAWLAQFVIICTYRTERLRIVGCSRMGDVWLSRNHLKENGYDFRAPVEHCTNWTVTVKEPS